MQAWLEHRILSRKSRPGVGLGITLIYVLILIAPQILMTNTLVAVFPPEIQPWLRMFSNLSVWAIVPMGIAVWLILSHAVDACALLLGAHEGDSKRTMEIFGYALIPAVLLGLIADVILFTATRGVQLTGMGAEAVTEFTQALGSSIWVQLALSISRTGLQLSMVVLGLLVTLSYRTNWRVGFTAVILPVGTWWGLTELVSKVAAR